ncbi:MAG: hypothetical protein WAV41_04305 [Microgenomates group bacterium]
MKLLAKFITFLPLVVLIIELVMFTSFNQDIQLSPQSNQNQYLFKLTTALQLSKISFFQLQLFDYRREAEFVVTNQSKNSFKVIISTQKDPLVEVAALQKLIKIANIDGRQISFVNLSSKRPYATF